LSGATTFQKYGKEAVLVIRHAASAHREIENPQKFSVRARVRDERDARRVLYSNRLRHGVVRMAPEDRIEPGHA